jgi:hypothetical protein
LLLFLDNDAEAIAALHLAKEMLHKGKREKSLKLYQHAVSLSPHHSDILNDYGEFLENSEKDIVNAEHMYCRALIVNSSHDKALENRKRTLPVVDEIDRKHLRYIETKRDFLSQVPEHNPALRRVKRENYFKHIHHSTAIEGNTFTLAQTRALIETGMAIAGKSVVEHNEILGMDAALTFMNTSLVHRIGNIVLQDILDLHLRVLGYVDPVAAGRFRTTQVYVGNLVPPPASELSGLMNDFIEWLNSDDANQLHPIQLAALAHYTLVAIHPFVDGNGRTSRLLTNLILMQAGYPPVTILNEDKLLYYRQLNVANDGDVRPFIRFITKCAEDTLDEYLWLVSGDPSVSKPKLGRTNPRIIILEGGDDVS